MSKIFDLQVLSYAVWVGRHFFIVLGMTACSILSTESWTYKQISKQQRFELTHKASADYEGECSSCHMAYPPAFLPKRSWRQLMADLSNHFGQNAELDESDNEKITRHLLSLAADSENASKRSRQMARMIPEDDVPIRITDTPFWRVKHGGIKAYIWKRDGVKSGSRCDVCHQDASKAIFQGGLVKIPKT